MRIRRRRIFMGAALAFGLLALLALDVVRGGFRYVWARTRGGYSVADRLEQFGPRVGKRLRPVFESLNTSYPPADIALLAFKDSRSLELYARSGEGRWKFIKSYPVLAASGRPGPKLVEGDRQVPEGLYQVESLNPNSRFHLSLRLNYPNAFDRRAAELDGRTNLGGDIMIHGSAVSIGCLAMGDDAAEDLFVLSALARSPVRVLIAPTDFRRKARFEAPAEPRWVTVLYGTLRAELRQFPK
jgi:hypothetical protein